MPRDSTRSTSLGNPYREQLLRVDFEDRASSQAFHRYQHHWRATLPRELRAERAERADGSAVRKAGQAAGKGPAERTKTIAETRPFVRNSLVRCFCFGIFGCYYRMFDDVWRLFHQQFLL